MAKRAFLSTASIVLTLAGVLVGDGGHAAESKAKPLRILASYEVPAAPSSPTDVRWASDRSVYLARVVDGVSEVGLEAGLPVQRQLFPDRNTFHFPSFVKIAASRDSMVVSGFANAFSWRQLASPGDGIVRFDHWQEAGAAEALDLAGDRLLLLGAPRYPAGDPRSRPGIAWTGTLHKRLQDLRPLLADSAAPDGSNLYNCLFQSLGAARFMDDGSMFVLPGFQPGAFLFGPAGELLQSWNTALLGLDGNSHCEKMEDAKRSSLYGSPAARHREINRHRVVDAVLAMPGGPAILVRSMQGDRPHWELDLLRGKSVEVFSVPLVGDRPYDRLRADARGGKIVFLLIGQSDKEDLSGRIVVAEMPDLPLAA